MFKKMLDDAEAEETVVSPLPLTCPLASDREAVNEVVANAPSKESEPSRSVSFPFNATCADEKLLWVSVQSSVTEIRGNKRKRIQHDRARR